MEKQGYPPSEQPPSYNSLATNPSDQMYPQVPEPANMQPYIPAPSPGYPSAPSSGYPSSPAHPAQGYQPVPTDPNQPDQSKGYQPNQPQQAMVGPATHIVMAPLVGPVSTPMTCPQCRSQISTRVEREVAVKAHIAAGILCLIGAWCCCCIPYCLDSCKVANHYCPSCGAFLGTYKQ